MDLTIITCAMKFHDPFIESNYAELRDKNINVRWIIVNNDVQDLSILSHQNEDPNLLVLKGPKLDETFGRISIGIQHSSALELASSHVKTEFLLILDPDFIVLDWNLILNYCFQEMVHRRYKAIATPWFITWYAKKSKSMAPHFVFSKTSLFQQNFAWYPLDRVPISWKTPDNKFKSTTMSALKNNKVIKLLSKLIMNRRRINTEFDTLGDTYLMGEEGQVLFFDMHVTKNQLKKISPHLYFKLGRTLESWVPSKYRYLSNEIRIAPFQLEKNCENIEHYGVDGRIWGVHLRGFGSGNLMSGNKDSLYNFSKHLNALTMGERTLFIK